MDDTAVRVDGGQSVRTRETWRGAIAPEEREKRERGGK